MQVFETIIIFPDYPKVSFIKKNDLDFDSVCNSLVVNTEIDTKSKIKIEDEFYYDTTGMLN